MAISTCRGAGHVELTAMPNELVEARRIADQVDSDSERPLFSVSAAGDRVALSEGLSDMVFAVVASLAREGSISIRSLSEELTTTTAASLLDISRPTLMQLIRDGQIPSHKKGTHHRLKAADVVDYMKRRRDDQRAAYDELRELLN